MPPEVQVLISTGGQALIWIAAVSAGVFAIVKLWPIISRFVATINALQDLPEFMERIRHQVENDHDTNLREEVSELLELATDTASKVATITDNVASLADWQQKHEAKSDAVVARVDRLEKKEAAA